MAEPQLQLPPGGKFERKVDPYEPNPVQRFLVDRVKSKINLDAATSNRWLVERGWFEKILFCAGHQWITYQGASRTFTEAKTPRWFPKVTDNQMRPRVLRMGAQFLKRPPSARVRPNSDEPQDQEAARDGEVVLSHIDDVVQETKRRQLAAVTVSQTGTVISREWFNPQAGAWRSVPRMNPEPRTVPMMRDASTCPTCAQDFEAEQAGMPCPACESNGYPSVTEPVRRQETLGDGSPVYDVVYDPVLDPATGEPMVDSFRLGEVQSEILLPFDFYLDEQADSLENAQWAAQVTYRDLDWIDRNFPDVARFVTEETGNRVSSFYRSALLNATNPARDTGLPFMGTTTMRGGAWVIDYEERPSGDFKTGMRIVVIGSVLAHAGPLPISDEKAEPELSFSMFVYDITPGSPWGDTPTTHLIPLQKRVNGIQSQIIWNRKTMLMPWILMPNGAGITPGTVAMVPGTVIPYNHQGLPVAPQVVPGQPLPAQIIDEWRMALDSMDKIAETQDVSGGDAPANANSGIFVAQLQEAAETVHKPRMERWEAFIAERGRKRLLLAQKYYREERLMKITAGTEFSVRRLSGADLRGNTDVTVEAGSSLPRSRTAQVQLILDMLQNQLFNPQLPLEPGVREQIIEEFGLSAIRSQVTPDRRRALNENAKMDAGRLPEHPDPFDQRTPSVSKYEDKLVHWKEHVARIKDPRFEQLPQEAQAAYLQHAQETKIAILIEIDNERAAQAQEQAPGEEQDGEEGPPQLGGPDDNGAQPESVAPSAGARQSDAPAEQPVPAGGG